MSDQVDYMTTKLKKADVFGHDFKMTFNGEKLYTTWCGTMLTTTLNIIILFYGAVMFLDLYNGKAIGTTDENIWFDMNRDRDGFNFGEAGFDFAIGFSDLNETLDPTIGTWEFSYHVKYNHTTAKVSVPVKSYPCEEKPMNWYNPSGESDD